MSLAMRYSARLGAWLPWFALALVSAGAAAQAVLAGPPAAEAAAAASGAAQAAPAGPAAAREKALLALRARMWHDALQLCDAGKSDEALRLVEQVVAHDRKRHSAERPEFVADSLALLATVELRREDFAAARRAAAECLALRMRQLAPGHWQVTDARYFLDTIACLENAPAELRRKHAESRRQFNEAIRGPGQSDWERTAAELPEIKKKIFGEDHPNFATSLHNLAVACYQRGDYARAEALCRRALEIRKQALGTAHPDYAASLHTLAAVYASRGDSQRAEPLYREAMEIRNTALGEEHLDYAGSLHGLAVLYADRGEFPRAEPLYRQALRITKELLGEDHPRYADTLNALADLYYAQGRLAQAEPLLRQAAETKRQALGADHPEYAVTLNDLALLYADQGDYARAEPLCRQALDITRNALGETHPSYAVGLANMAMLYANQGHVARAASLYRQAFELQRRTIGETHPACIQCLRNLALAYADQGDDARAETLLRRASETSKTVLGEGHPEYANALACLAKLYCDRQDFARAEPLFRQALEIRAKTLGTGHPEYATAVSNLGTLCRARGDFAQAEKLYRQACGVFRAQLEATSVVQSERQQLAMLQSVRRFLDNYLSLAVESRRYADQVYREMLAWKGSVLLRQRQMRAAGTTAETSAVFGQLQRVVLQWAKLAQATPDPKQATSWRERVAELAAERERLEAELSRRSAAYRRAKRLATPQELQAALPKDVALLDFLEFLLRIAGDARQRRAATAERHLLACVVRKDQPIQFVDLGPAGPLAEAIDTWRASFGTSPDGRAAGKLLRERIWEPLEPQLDGARIVLVSPDGALARLPLAALPGKKPGTYLLEERTFGLVPVPQVLAEVRDERGGRQLKEDLLLVGDVDYDAHTARAPQAGPRRAEPGESVRPPADRAGQRMHFDPLPGTQGELALIAAMYRRAAHAESPAALLTGDRASKRAFCEDAPRHRSIHVATHGYFLPAECRSALAAPPTAGRSLTMAGEAQGRGWPPGLLCGLALAGANHAAEQAASLAAIPDDQDNGILTAEEIGDMNLEGTELVVLSACDTGLGAVAGGEGLLGLQRAFQAAGARNVVASLWRVDDQATAALMRVFYAKLWQEKLSPSEALRQAQLYIFRHPGEIGRLATARSPQFENPLQLPEMPAAPPAPQPASPKLWAGFVLSGAGP
jgi:CHAT domain-containing protein/tetratricopeptide (TPR) repeat protein